MRSTRPLLALLLAVLSLAALALSPAARAQDTARFFSAIEDLPLMAGLVETGEGVNFEGPQGRIAETVAEGAVPAQAVLDFYAATLPQLGWQATAPGAFWREGEALTLTVRALAAGRLRLDLRVRPAAAPPPPR